MNFDIIRAMDTLGARRNVHTNAESYYQGSHREVFANARWSFLFRENGTYVLNYCKTIVDTVLDRLEISTVEATTKAAQKAVDEMWEENELQIDATEIHRRALVYGECYAMVWPDDDGDVTITYNSPLTTVMVYDEENPRVKKFAAKLWEVCNVLGVKTTFLNLYYTDRIEKYSRQGELSIVGAGGDGNGWSLNEIVENPFGQIPVFHFRTHRPFGTPEHAAAIGAQDAINKLVNNHMLTVDYQGAPQRYALSSGGNSAELTDFDEGEAARENLEGLKTGPGEFWYLNGITQVGQFNPAMPETFTNPILDYVKYMASLTQTPLHFFQSGTTFSSGEALRNAEAPLTKKVRERQLTFGQTWRELFKFALKIEGFDVDVQIMWGTSESMDVSDAWNIASVKRNLGIPLDVVLMEMGYDTEIAKQLAEAAQKEKDANNPLKNGQIAGPGQDNTPPQNAASQNMHNQAVHAAAEARKNEEAAQAAAELKKQNKEN
jgi:hypothetical protein